MVLLNKHWYLWVCNPSGLPLCDAVEFLQLASCSAFWPEQGKRKASVGVVAGDGRQEGLQTGAGKPWRAILHKKKVIGLLIALRGMFHRPSQFTGLPSASVQVLCQTCVIWPEHEADERKRQLFLLPLHSITLHQACHAASAALLISLRGHSLLQPNTQVSELLNRTRIDRNYISAAVLSIVTGDTPSTAFSYCLF